MPALTEERPRRAQVVKKRYLIGTALTVALVVLLVGSYRGGWAWTGFKANGTMWAWLNLLLLPVAVGTLPLWFGGLSERGPWWGRWWVWALVALSTAFLIVTVCGYAFSWGWTGLQGNTLWDWLKLMLVPVVLPVGTFWLSQRAEESRGEKRPSGTDD